MIEYISSVSGTDHTPRLLKQLISDGEIQMSAAIDIYDQEEMAQVPEEIILEHMENLLTYVKSKTEKAHVPGPGTRIEGVYPIIGWEEVVATATQLCDLWYWKTRVSSVDILEQE